MKEIIHLLGGSQPRSSSWLGQELGQCIMAAVTQDKILVPGFSNLLIFFRLVLKSLRLNV